MKKLQKFALLLIAVAAVSLTACKDDDEDDTPSNTDNLTEKNFVLTGFDLKVDGTSSLGFNDIDDCSKDGFTRFERNGTAVDNEGATKCDPSDPQTESYAWLFLENETKLQLDFGMGDLEVFSLLINDGTTLQLQQTEVEDFNGDGNDNTLITTVTFTKQ